MRVPELSGVGSRSGRDRAVSPVVGVVLLVGVTVILGLTIGPFVLGTVGDLSTGTPSADLAFYYDGSVDDGRVDDFGTQVAAGDGLVVVTLESSESLDPSAVEIRGITSGGNLQTDTGADVYASGDRFRQGETMSVVATRGETVRVIWTGQDGDSAEVLAELTVPGVRSSVPPGVPEPTLGCDWVDSQTTGGDLVVAQGGAFQAGDVVACESFDSLVSGTVDIDGDLTVVGNIDASEVELGSAGFAESGDLYGGVESSGDVDLSGLAVTDGVTAGDDITLDGVTVEDDIDATDAATVDNATVEGVVTGGDLTLDNATVRGDAAVGGTLTCTGETTVAGEDCAVYRTSKFDVSVTGTTYPGVENETVRVETVVENTRIDAGSRNVTLVADGTARDSATVSGLDGNRSELVVLSYVPAAGDAGDVSLSVETNETGRDVADSQTLSVVENRTDRPVVEEFAVTSNNNELVVDWNVSADTANLSSVTVELRDGSGTIAGAETWFLDEQSATGSVTVDGLAEVNHSVTLDVSDQDSQFVREIEVAKPG